MFYHLKTLTKEEMAKPGVIYRINWHSFHESADIQCYVDISDTDNLIGDSDDPVIHELIGSGVNLSVIDNDNNPFKPIRGQQLTIQFNSTVNYGMANFSGGSDQRWSVHYYIDDDTKTVFKGFLVLDDLSEPLLPPTEVVTLTATDNLGLLKDIPLTNADEVCPVGMYRIIDLIELALAKTGLDLGLAIAFNVKLSDDVTDISSAGTTDEHLFDRIYLDARTFENELTTCKDCYEVLERILGHEACLFQMKGKWWIVRVDEIEDTTRGLYITYYDGSTFSNLGEIHFNKYIGLNEYIKLSQEASIVKPVRPQKSVRLNFNYVLPGELPTNKNFLLGEENYSSGDTKRYNLDSWILRQGIGSGVDVPNAFTYIERKFSSGQESERYAVITSPTSPTALTYIESDAVPIGIKDKFDFSVDFAWGTTASGSTYNQDVMTIRLEGDDGTYWTLGDDSIWYQSNSSWSTNFKYIKQSWTLSDVDEREFRTRSISANPAPVSGNLFFMLYGLNQQSGTSDDDTEIHFSNISYSPSPFINGSYQAFDGQYHYVSQDGNYKAKIEEEVYISDSPKRAFKGAMQKIDSYGTVFSGSVDFLNGTAISIPGIHYYKFRKGMILKISGSTLNNQTTRVVSSSYKLLTSSSEIIIEGVTVSESISATLETPVFVLANEFYNAAVNPTGPPSSDYVHTYGEIQLFDVWNQHKTEKRLVDNTSQGLDLNLLDANNLPDTAHLINKWKLTDSSPHLNNRFFQLLSFNQNHDNAEWTGTLREVFNTGVEKSYLNHEFKFIENG